MEAKDVAVWIGIASSIAGVAVGYGTLTEKVSTLEKSTDATHLESRLTKLEVRSDDADLGHIGSEIQTIRGDLEALGDKVSRIRVPSTSAIKTDVRLLQSKVDSIEEQLKGQMEQVEKLKDASKPLL